MAETAAQLQATTSAKGEAATGLKGGEANPYFAKYYTTLAALNFSQASTEAKDKLDEERARATSFFNRTNNARAEGLKLNSSLGTANTEGLAESGVLAKQQGTLQTQYAQKAQSAGRSRELAVQNARNTTQLAQESTGLKKSEALATDEGEYAKELEANPPQPAPAAPAAPVVPPVVVGVKTQPSSAGGPKAEAASRKSEARRAAIKKIVG
jgi:hypothetical protein